MKLEEIREKVAINGYVKQSLRQALLDWLTGRCGDLNLDTGLTLMPSKVFYKRVPNKRGGGRDLMRHLRRDELEAANKRFVELLNKTIYKEGYKRFNKRLDIVAVIEGKRELKDIHTHFAFKRPAEMQTNEFARCVLKALQLNGQFEIYNQSYNALKDSDAEKYRYKLEIIDGGWQSYITKKLEGRDLENLYLL